MLPPIPSSWNSVLGDEVREPYFKELAAFVDAEQQAGDIFPPAECIFAALEMTPFDQVGVVLLGQDPYPTPGHAHGLCFSVQPAVQPLPFSLRNIFRELQDDVGCHIPNNGYLE